MWSPARWSLSLFLPAGILRKQGFLSNGGRCLPSPKIIKCEIPLIWEEGTDSGVGEGDGREGKRMTNFSFFEQ